MSGIVPINNDVNIAGVGATRFGELEVAYRASQINFKPTWGVTALRYATVTTGTGASVGQINGEFVLQSGTSANNIASIRTIQRGQYQAGTMGQMGIGVRIPVMPTGTQFMEWGFTDFNQSGFFFGVDVNGYYIGYISQSATTKIYQNNWNTDKLNGTGKSGLVLNLAQGNITQIDFVWYGYGDIDFKYYIFDAEAGDIRSITAHHLDIDGQLSIDDPNQPLMFRVGNGNSSTTNLVLNIGGHQFSVIDGNSQPQRRTLAELVTNYTTATNTNWQPIIAVRKKTTFLGKANSITAFIKQYEIAADGEIEVRLTINAVTSNLSWATPTGWSADETGIETKVTGATALTTSTDGYPMNYGFISSNNKGNASFTENSVIFLGAGIEGVLWIRRLSASGSLIVKHAHIQWEEEW